MRLHRTELADPSLGFWSHATPEQAEISQPPTCDEKDRFLPSSSVSTQPVPADTIQVCSVTVGTVPLWYSFKLSRVSTT